MELMDGKKRNLLIGFVVLALVVVVVGVLISRGKIGKGASFQKVPVPAKIADNKAVSVWSFAASGKVTALNGNQVTIVGNGESISFNVDDKTLYGKTPYFQGDGSGGVVPYKNGDIKMGDNISAGMTVRSQNGMPVATLIAPAK